MVAGFQSTSLMVTNSVRDLTLQCSSKRVADEWEGEMNRLLSLDEGSKPEKRYESFAPQHNNQHVKWYVDGKEK